MKTPKRPLLKDQNKGTKKNRKSNVSDTSKGAWAIINSSGKVKREQAAVFKALEQLQPTTSRIIAEELGIERTNITRCLKNLEDSERIEVVYKAKCITTGIRVKYYARMDWKPKEVESNEQP